MANFEGFELAEQQISDKGARFCPLSCKGERVYLTLGSKTEPLYTQWGPSNFDPTTATSRCNFDFVCDEKLSAQLGSLDAWALNYIEKNAPRILGKSLTKEQVQDGYKPALVLRGSYPTQVRCKINLAGQRAVRCWDEAGQPREMPQDWKGCRYVAKVNLSHLYIMSKEFGWVFNLTDIQIFEDARVCPAE